MMIHYHFNFRKMAKEEFTQEMYEKSIDVALKLSKVLADEGSGNDSTVFMMFCVARFTAGLLLALQKYNNDIDFATEYTDLVKKMMEDMSCCMNEKSVKKQMMEDVDLAKLNLREEDILRMIRESKDKKGN